MNSTPINVLHDITGNLPIEFRRKILREKLVYKIFGFKNHYLNAILGDLPIENVKFNQ